MFNLDPNNNVTAEKGYEAVANPYHGQGYGGGGNSHEAREGLQGVIILEVVSG